MRWAREAQIRGGSAYMPSLNEFRGASERQREDRQSKQQQDFRRVLRDVARDTSCKSGRLATTRSDCIASLPKNSSILDSAHWQHVFHPDRGGSKDE